MPSQSPVRIWSRTYESGKKSWGIDCVDDNGERVRRLIGTKKQATAVAKKMEAEAFNGRYRIAETFSREVITLSKLLLETWPENSEKRSQKTDLDRSKRLLKHFGPDRDISTIKRTDVVAFQRALKRSKSKSGSSFAPATINRYVELLRSAMNVAVKNEWIQRNPCTVNKLAVHNERDRVCTREEFQTLLALERPGRPTSEDLRTAIILGYYCGMRLGEIAEMTWDRIDLKKQEIKLRSVDTKTSKARVVPLNDNVCHHLRGLQNKKGSLGSVSSHSLTGQFTRLRDACGIEDLRFHDLRHTCATNLRRAGVDFIVIMRMMGWTTMETMKRYQTVHHDELHEAAGRLSG